MEKCKYCGKEYRENPMSHIEKLPEFIKEKIKYIVWKKYQKKKWRNWRKKGFTKV